MQLTDLDKMHIKYMLLHDLQKGKWQYLISFNTDGNWINVQADTLFECVKRMIENKGG